MAKGAMVVVGADVQEAIVGLDSVGVAAQRAAGATATGFQNAVVPTHAFNRAQQDLQGTLMGVQREMRTGDRVSAFYAKQLAGILPVGNDVKEVMGGMVGTTLDLSDAMKKGAGGMAYMLLAFQAIQTGIAVYNMLTAETKKAEEATEKLRLKTLDLAATLSKDVAKSVDDLRGRMEKAFGLDPQEQVNKRKVLALRTQLELLKAVEDQKAKAGEYEGQGQRQADIAKVTKDLAEATTAQKVYITVRDRTISQEKTIEDADKAKKTRQEAEIKRVKDLADAIALLNKTEAEGADRGNFPDMFYDQKKSDEMQGTKDKKLGDDAAQKVLTFNNNAEAEAADKGNFPDLAKTNEKVKTSIDLAKELKDAYSQVGNGIASTFSTMGSAIGGTAGEFIKQIGSMIAQTLALIVALATSDTLMTGPLGVFAAIPMAAGILASVVGMIAGIGARALGGPVTAGQPYLVGERGPELIVPSGNGFVVPNNQLAGMGGGGMVVNIHASSLDAAWWKKNQGYVLGTIRNAQKNRRSA